MVTERNFVPAVVPAFSVRRCRKVAYYGAFWKVAVQMKTGLRINDLGPFLLVAGGGFEPPTFGL